MQFAVVVLNATVCNVSRLIAAVGEANWHSLPHGTLPEEAVSKHFSALVLDMSSIGYVCPEPVLANTRRFFCCRRCRSDRRVCTSCWTATGCSSTHATTSSHSRCLASDHSKQHTAVSFIGKTEQGFFLLPCYPD